MRHLISSRTEMVGGAENSLALPMPQPSTDAWHDYRHIAVMAFPTPAGDDGADFVPTRVRGSEDKQPWVDLLNGVKDVSIRLIAPSRVEVSFAQAVTLHSLELPPVEKLTMRRSFDPGAAIHVQALVGNGLVEVAGREIPRSNWRDDQPLVLAPEAQRKTWAMGPGHRSSNRAIRANRTSRAASRALGRVVRLSPENSQSRCGEIHPLQNPAYTG